MDYDLSSLDDLLEDRQNLSQYSYDPTDPMDSIGDSQPTSVVAFGSSQQSSQASEKFDGCLEFGDARYDDDDNYADYLGFDDQMPTADITTGGFAEHAADPDSDVPISILPTVLIDAVDDDDQVETHPVEIKHESTIDPRTAMTIAPLNFEYFGNKLELDVKSESMSSSVQTAVWYSPPDSTNTNSVFFDDDDDDDGNNESVNNCSISDEELLSLSTRDLNRRIRLLSADEQRKIKSRRRTLKNRGYAQTCRTRRVGQRSELEADNERLSSELEQLRSDNKSLSAERDRLRQGNDLVTTRCSHEIQTLRANNKQLMAECDRLRQEGEQFRLERDACQGRLDALVNVLAINGFLVNQDDVKM